MGKRTTPRGPVLTDMAAPVHRQCPTGWWKDDENRPSSQLFQPTDDNLTSLDDGRNGFSARMAYDAHIDRGHESRGVATVLVQDFADLGLEVHLDEMLKAEDGFDNPRHCVGDFRTLGNKQAKKAAAKLLERCGKRLSYDPKASQGDPTSPAENGVAGKLVSDGAAETDAVD